MQKIARRRALEEVAYLERRAPPLPRTPSTFAAAAAIIVMLGSALVLLGWAIDPELRAFTPGRETTKPLGALGLLCGSAALLLLLAEDGSTPSRWRGLRLVFAGVPVLIGALTLTEQGTGLDVGIHRLLFPEALAAEGPYAGRPVFPISLCLVLLGLALVTLGSRLQRLGNAMVLAVLFVGLLVLAGYLYGAVPLYRVEPQRSVPVVAAVLVVVLGLGCFAARPESALVELVTSRLAGGVAARRLLPAAILLPLSLGLLRLAGQRIGLYGTEFGLALFASLNISVFVALVYSSARRLDEADARHEAAHAALLESEESFRRLLNATPSGLVMVGGDGRIAVANATVERLFGYEPGDLAGQPVEVLVPQRLRSPHPALRRGFEPGERPHVLGGGRDLAGVRKDGVEFPVEIAVCSVETPRGRFTLASIVDITERKRAADEIRSLNASLERRVAERTRQLSRAQEIAHLGSWELDLAEDELSWSDEVYRIFGLAPQEFEATYAAFLEAVHPEDRAAVDAAYSGSIREGRDSYEIEHRVVRRSDGEVRFVHEKCTHVRDETGRVVRSAGMVHDITERRRAEEALRESEERYRSIARNIPDGTVALFDRDLRHVVADGPLLARVGLDRTQVEGRTLREVLGDRAADAEQRVRSAFTGKAASHEFVFQGRHVWVQYVPLRDEHGAVATVMTVALDVTDRKRAEAALKESEQRFRALADSLPNLVWSSDARGVTDYRNRRWIEYGGGTLEREPGAWKELIHPDDRDRVLGGWEESLLAGRPYEAEYRLRRADGQYRWFIGRGYPVRGSEGEVVRWFGTLTDVHELREAREALRDREARLRAILENMSEGLMLFDAHGNLVYQNPASLRIHGFEPRQDGRIERESLPTTWNAWDDKGRPITFDEWPVSRALRHERFQNQVLHVQRVETGQEFDASYNGSPIHDSAGNLVAGFITIREITEELRANRALRESEDRLRMAQVAGRVGTFEWNVQSGVNTWSEELEAMYGLAAGEFKRTQRAWEEMLHPEDRARAVRAVEKAFETGEPGEAEFRVVWPDRSIRWLSARWQLFPDEHGKPLRLTGVNIDVTPRKEAEESLRQATERERALAGIIENASFAFGMGAPDGRMLLFNRAFEELTGYSREEIEARALTWTRDLTPPEWREKEAEALARAIANHESVRYEKECQRKDGSRVPIELIVQPVFAEDGSVAHYWSFLTDITERKAATEALRASEERLRLALDAARMGSWLYDPKTRLASFDDRYCEIFGVTGSSRANEIVARIHPDDRPGVWARVEAALDPSDPQPYSAEYRIAGPDGATKWIEAHGTASFEGEGSERQATRLVGTVADITERKQAQAQLSSTLQQKEALLKEIHHRVKNNMQVVCSLLRLQSDALRDPLVHEVLGESQRRVRAMALLHEQLYRSPDLARIDFREYALSLVSYLRRSLAPGKSRVELRVEVEGVLLEMERAMPLGLLVSELVSNSLKHAFPREGRGERHQVWVSARREAGCGLTLTVGDDGVGLPEAVDLDASPTMGWKLVRSFVEQLQGRLGVERRAGTVVTVTVPEREG